MMGVIAIIFRHGVVSNDPAIEFEWTNSLVSNRSFHSDTIDGLPTIARKELRKMLQSPEFVRYRTELRGGGDELIIQFENLPAGSTFLLGFFRQFFGKGFNEFFSARGICGKRTNSPISRIIVTAINRTDKSCQLTVKSSRENSNLTFHQISEELLKLLDESENFRWEHEHQT